MALDGFDKRNPEVVDQLTTEAFLRRCRDKEAAISVLEKDLSSITQAVKMIKTYIANQRYGFMCFSIGFWNCSYSVALFVFLLDFGTVPKEWNY